ncbi:hypothetical protein D3C84_1142920 [compost metagenome]
MDGFLRLRNVGKYFNPSMLFLIDDMYASSFSRHCNGFSLPSHKLFHIHNFRA